MFVRHPQIGDPRVIKTFDTVDKILDAALYYFHGSTTVSTSQNGLFIFRIPYWLKTGTLVRMNAWQRGDLLVDLGFYSSLAGDEDVDFTLSGGVDGSGLTVIDTRTITVPASGGEIHEEFFKLANVDLGLYDFLTGRLAPVGGFPAAAVGLSVLWRPLIA